MAVLSGFRVSTVCAVFRLGVIVIFIRRLTVDRPCCRHDGWARFSVAQRQGRLRQLNDTPATRDQP